MATKIEFIMIVGLPGCGKSTYAAHLKEEKGFSVHSLDELREELFGSADEQGRKDILFTELHKRVRDDLLNGLSCVYDATNFERKYRLDLLSKIAKLDVKKTCVLFVLPVEECKQRNGNRDRQVPDDVYDKMLRRFQCPFFYEGWDNIYAVAAKDCSYHYPIEETYTFEQHNSHHSKRLFNHMHDTAVYLAEQPQGCSKKLFEAALNHDIGKIYTQTFTDAKGNPTGEAHYYGHENVGAYMYLLSEFYGSYTTVKESLSVATLINWHMRPSTAWAYSEKAREKDRKLIGEEIYKAVMLLHEADQASR